MLFPSHLLLRINAADFVKDFIKWIENWVEPSVFVIENLAHVATEWYG
jgi:hypothetical protein